jgi:actin-related protein
MASVKFYEREKEMQKEKERIKQIEILKNEQTSYNSRKNSGSIDKDKLKDSFSSKSIDDLNFKKEKNILKPSNDVDHGKKLDRQAEKILKTVDLEINRFPYEKALQFDDRTYLEYYCSLLRTKHLLIFSFYPIEDYNLMPIKIYLFFFSFGLYFTINALFFTNSTMHRIYEDQGSFNFVFQIPQIFYSTIISAIFTVIIKYLALTDQEILNIKQENKKRKISQAFVNAIRCTLIKFLIFFIM